MLVCVEGTHHCVGETRCVGWCYGVDLVGHCGVVLDLDLGKLDVDNKWSESCVSYIFIMCDEVITC